MLSAVMRLLGIVSACLVSAAVAEDHSSDFDTYDANQDGYLDAQEIRVKYKDLTEQELHNFWTAIDKQQRGYFTKAEYITYALAQADYSE